MNSLVELPTSTEFINNIGSWSKPVFNALLNLVYLEVGVAIGVFLTMFLIYAIQAGFQWIIQQIKKEKDGGEKK